MKKSASSKRRYARIGVAVALGAMCLGTAGVAVAQTSNSIYGNFRYSLSHVDQDRFDENAEVWLGADDTIRGDNQASRLGVRGEVKGDVLTAFYHVEGGLNNDAGGNGFSSRFFYAGVKGDFGSALVGRHSTAYKMAGLGVDPFYDTSTANATGGFGGAGATYGLSPMTNGFANNTLAYTSPKLGPVTLNAAVYFDDTEENDHDYAAGIAFAEGPVTAGFQYYQTGESANAWDNAAGADPLDTGDRGQKAYRVHGSFATGPIKLGASAEMLDPDSAGSDDIKYYFLSATYSIVPTTRLSAAFGMVDDGPNEGNGYHVGVFHDVVPNATVYALYSKADLDKRDDTDIFSLGFIYNFNMSL